MRAEDTYQSAGSMGVTEILTWVRNEVECEREGPYVAHRTPRNKPRSQDPRDSTRVSE